MVTKSKAKKSKAEARKWLQVMSDRTKGATGRKLRKARTYNKRGMK